MGTRRTKRGARKPAAPTLRAVTATLEELAPVAGAAGWDNVGLLAGDPEARVRRAMLCIDLMPAVVDEAIAAKVDLAIAYHPPIFRKVDRLVHDGDAMAAQVWRCVRAGVAIYSPHTALDAAPGGTNDVLANLCGMVGDRAPLEADPVDPSQGIGRLGRLKRPTSLERLAKKLRRSTGSPCVASVGSKDQAVERALVCVGAAGDLAFAANPGPGDVVVTGEMRHHDALRLLRRGATAIVLSHWSSERPALRHLADHLNRALEGRVELLLSEADAEPFHRV